MAKARDKVTFRQVKLGTVLHCPVSFVGGTKPLVGCVYWIPRDPDPKGVRAVHMSTRPIQFERVRIDKIDGDALFLSRV